MNLSENRPELRNPAQQSLRIWVIRLRRERRRVTSCVGGITRAELRRQDSNLNYLNQNQKCCRLHHDGSLRPAVKTGFTLDDRAERSRTAAEG